ncbi:MAG: hypothetical protein ACM3RP_02475 [Chitinophagales bacterium]
MGEPAEKMVWDGLPETQPGRYLGRGGRVQCQAAGHPLLIAGPASFPPGTFASPEQA